MGFLDIMVKLLRHIYMDMRMCMLSRKTIHLYSRLEKVGKLPVEESGKLSDWPQEDALPC